MYFNQLSCGGCGAVLPRDHAAAEEGAAAAPPAVPIAGKRADVIQAAQTALTVAHKLMRPGATSLPLTSLTQAT